jgi:hypothetical protein
MKRVTYTLKVTYRDGTGHQYTKLTRVQVARLAARQFDAQYVRPETVQIVTVRS